MPHDGKNDHSKPRNGNGPRQTYYVNKPPKPAHPTVYKQNKALTQQWNQKAKQAPVEPAQPVIQGNETDLALQLVRNIVLLRQIVPRVTH